MKLRPEITPRFAKHIGIIGMMVLVAWIIFMGLMTRPNGSGITTKFIYIQYAIIDIAVPDVSGNLLFDKLTTRLRAYGTIDLDDQATAMAISAYGESDPERLGFQYNMPDNSKVALGIFRPTNIVSTHRYAYSPYDPAKTYVVLFLGYGAEGVERSIVSRKILELVRTAKRDCVMADIRCSIRARLPAF